MRLAAILALSLMPIVASSGSSCGAQSAWTSCEVSNNGSQVDVGGTANHPGSSGGSGTSGSGGSRGGAGTGSSGAGNSNGNGNSGTGSGSAGTGSGSTANAAEETCPIVGCRGNYTVVTFPDVTIDDLTSFVPARPSLGGEPAGFGVVGMPTNIIAAASTHVRTGPLLGWDVTVRFRPVGFLFDYGDGSNARTTTGGATWASLGLPQFSPTSTSHVYRDRGTYTVTLTVQYAADVDFGSGWRPVPGYVNAPAPPYGLEVLEVRTALVERTCAENPAGPGC